MKNNFRKKVLKNGMTILFEKRDVPVVSVAFTIKSGSLNESLGEKGINHFIEHMLYKGTVNRTNQDISMEIEKNGGEINGFTSEELVAYWCKMPADKLNVALDVLGDIVRNPLFDEEELEKERKVIFEEIKMRKDNPQIYSFDKVQETLYSGVLGVSGAGTEKTMNSITRKDIVKRFRELYATNNLILIVVGNADFDKIVKFAEKNFVKGIGKIKKGKFGLKNEFVIEKRNGVDQANLVFAYHVPKVDNNKNYVAQILSALMAEGMSSRLFIEIREKRNLAYAIKGGSDINKNFAYNFIYVGTTKEKVKEVKNLIVKEFEKVSNSLDEKELGEIKNQLIGQWEIKMEDSQEQMVNLLVHEVCGNAYEFYEYDKNIKKVKLKDVKSMAKKVIKKHSFFALVPE